MRHQRGFTLIELSIVLVIIGLVVGGAMVGKHLIQVAELNATVSQLEKYRTAVNVFRNKYGNLPSDIPPMRAAQFGLFQITGNCGAECPYGNGLIYTGGSPVLVYETYVFWRHLSQANLIESLNNPSLQANDGFFSGTGEGIAPPVKYMPDRYWYLRPGRRHDAAGVTETGSNDFVNYQYISPVEAHLLDTKIDDGMPRTGKMLETNGPDDGSWSDAIPEDWACTFEGVDQFSPQTRYNIINSAAGTRAGFKTGLT